MQIGYTQRFYPNSEQCTKLLQWLGCYRFIWNSKIKENEYFYTFGKKFVPVTKWLGSKDNKNPEFEFIDQKFSQFKSDELTPWLSDCPSQILRNSAAKWYETQRKFMSRKCGAPKIKRKEDGGSMLLTKEVFKILSVKNNVATIFIGAKKNNIGTIRLPLRKPLKAMPNSITIKLSAYGKWNISFSSDDMSGMVSDENELRSEWLNHLKTLPKAEIEQKVCGIDRGVSVPIVACGVHHNLEERQKASLKRQEIRRKKWQRRLERQKKNSKRRGHTKARIAQTYEKQTNVRKDFAHKATHALIHKTDRSVFVLEDLKTKNMTASAKGTKENPGKNVKQKSGLNREILSVGWHRIETYLTYKAIKKGKIVFKVSPQHTSQECSDCGHIHKDNRPEQSLFVCQMCGHTENADSNASRVIASRAVKLILDSGTELSETGLLKPRADIERLLAKTQAKSGARRARQPAKKDEAA